MKPTTHIKILIHSMLTFLIGVLLFGNIAQAQESKVKSLRVMSFNIRLGVAKDGDNHWDKRKNLVVKTIEEFNADIVGTQETWNFQAEFLSQELDGYSYAGRSRQAQPDEGEQCGILFRSSRFDKLVEGHFWLSESPDQPASKSWDSSLPRMATWLKLWDRDNDKSFYVINTHFDHRGETARYESSSLIRRFITSLGVESEVVITGDFNAGVGSWPYAALFGPDDRLRNVLDTFRVRYPERSPSEGTFNGFKATDSGDRIDWIGATTGWEIESASIVKTHYDNRYPSDHFPVTAVLNLKTVIGEEARVK